MFRYKKEQSDGNSDFDKPHQRNVASWSVKENWEHDEDQRAVEEIMNNSAKHAYSIVDNFVSASTDKTCPSEGSGNMTVGPGVQMEGAIRHFEKLVILGSSEGDLEGENLIIGEGGCLSGTASIRNMEIVGTFQGTANVSGHIRLRSTGSIAGQITYTSIEIEDGGKISGEMYPAQNIDSNGKKPDSLNENLPIVDTVELPTPALVDEEKSDE